MGDKDNELWAYDEPHPSGGNIHTTMTRRQAIDYQRSIRPYAPDAPDASVFADWQIVHWAYKAENATGRSVEDLLSECAPTPRKREE